MAASADQRAAAMATAAEVRKRRAEVLAGLTAGDTSLADVLRSARSDPVVGSIKVLKVVEALPGARKVTSRRTLEGLGIAESARVGTLGDAERAALVSGFSPG